MLNLHLPCTHVDVASMLQQLRKPGNLLHPRLPYNAQLHSIGSPMDHPLRRVRKPICINQALQQETNKLLQMRADIFEPCFGHRLSSQLHTSKNTLTNCLTLNFSSIGW